MALARRLPGWWRMSPESTDARIEYLEEEVRRLERRIQHLEEMLRGIEEEVRALYEEEELDELEERP